MNPASALAAQRATSEKTCAYCGRTFIGITIALYCCGSCRKMASRKRLTEQRRERPETIASGGRRDETSDTERDT